jgi:hypothetical protein
LTAVTACSRGVWGARSIIDLRKSIGRLAHPITGTGRKVMAGDGAIFGETRRTNRTDPDAGQVENAAALERLNLHGASTVTANRPISVPLGYLRGRYFYLRINYFTYALPCVGSSDIPSLWAPKALEVSNPELATQSVTMRMIRPI